MNFTVFTSGPGFRGHRYTEYHTTVALLKASLTRGIKSGKISSASFREPLPNGGYRLHTKTVKGWISEIVAPEKEVVESDDD